MIGSTIPSGFANCNDHCLKCHKCDCSLILFIFVTLSFFLFLPSKSKSLKPVFESPIADKVSITKLKPQIACNSSVRDLSLRLNQSNNVNAHVIDSASQISNDNYYNKSNPIMENHRDNLYPKMNFTSSTVTAATTAPAPPSSLIASDNISMKPESAATKCKYMDNVSNRNDQSTMQNVTTHNFNVTNSFGSTAAMPNLNSSSNCNYITTPTSGQQQQQQQQLVQPQQQQPPPPTLSSSFAYSSISNATQIQTINGQSSQQRQSQQIFGTKVTRRKLIALFHAFVILY